MGTLSYYLGVHFVWGCTSDGRLTVHMLQAGHIHKMLEKHDLDDPASLHPVKTPFRSGMAIDSVPHDGLEPESKPELVTQFQSLVGSFNWLAGSTRPDIAAVTSLLGSHLAPQPVGRTFGCCRTRGPLSQGHPNLGDPLHSTQREREV